MMSNRSRQEPDNVDRSIAGFRCGTLAVEINVALRAEVGEALAQRLARKILVEKKFDTVVFLWSQASSQCSDCTLPGCRELVRLVNSLQIKNEILLESSQFNDFLAPVLAQPIREDGGQVTRLLPSERLTRR